MSTYKKLYSGPTGSNLGDSKKSENLYSTMDKETTGHSNQNNLTEVTNIIRNQINSKSSYSYGSNENHEKSGAEYISTLCETFIEIRQGIDEHTRAVLKKKYAPLIDDEKEKLLRADPHLILQNLKQIVSYYVRSLMDLENEMSQKKEGECSDYENMLQKLEAEVRQHIRIEQQLKLYAESTQSKLEDQEKEKECLVDSTKKTIEELKRANEEMYENMKKKDSEIESLKRELKHKNELLKSHEDHIKSINRPNSSTSNTQNSMAAVQPQPSASTINMKKRERSISRDGLDGYYMKMYKPQLENSTDGSGKTKESEGERLNEKSTSKHIDSTTEEINRIKYQMYEKNKEIENIKNEFRKEQDKQESLRSENSRDKMRKYDTTADKSLQNEKSLIKILQKKLDERDAELEVLNGKLYKTKQDSEIKSAKVNESVTKTQEEFLKAKYFKTLQPGQQHEIEHYLNACSEMNSSFQGKMAAFNKASSNTGVSEGKRKDEEKRSVSRSKREEGSYYVANSSSMVGNSNVNQNSSSKETLEKSKLFSTLYTKNTSKPLSPGKKAPMGMVQNSYVNQKKEADNSMRSTSVDGSKKNYRQAKSKNEKEVPVCPSQTTNINQVMNSSTNNSQNISNSNGSQLSSSMVRNTSYNIGAAPSGVVPRHAKNPSSGISSTYLNMGKY